MQEEDVEKEKIVGFRVSDHIYVPKHEILSEEEAKELLQKVHAKPEQLPYIHISDPVVREIGAKPGQILKITRKSETAGESVYYRYVVE
ncbi:MAG: DNA-directed RNA polymerase subunit H [Nitrososphaerales archaeon]